MPMSEIVKRQDRRWISIVSVIALVLILGAMIQYYPAQSQGGLNLSSQVQSLLLTGQLERGTGIPDKTTPDETPELDRKFQAAIQQMREQDYQSAFLSWHEIIRIQPALVEAHVNLAYTAFALEDFEASKAIFQVALDLNPQQLNAYYGLAMVYEQMGEMELALGAMRTYSHLTPTADPFKRKADAAIWEWSAEQESESRLQEGSQDTK
jgi:Tfp pilus assembly protein PilF